MVEWVKIGIIGGGLFIVLAIGSFVYHYLKEKKEEKIKLGVGYDATRKFLKENKKISDHILKEIKKKFAEEA